MTCIHSFAKQVACHYDFQNGKNDSWVQLGKDKQDRIIAFWGKDRGVAPSWIPTWIAT